MHPDSDWAIAQDDSDLMPQEDVHIIFDHCCCYGRDMSAAGSREAERRGCHAVIDASPAH